MITVRILQRAGDDDASCRRRALERHAPDDFRISVGDVESGTDLGLGEIAPDVVVLLDPACSGAVRTILGRNGWTARLVTDWRGGWPERLASLSGALWYSDHVVFNNEDYWSRAGRPSDSSVIPDGVDLDAFSASDPAEERGTRVLWVGERDDSDRTGFARLLVPLRNEMRVLGIELDLRRLDEGDRGDDLAEWYRSGCLFVCADRSRGYARYAFEAAAAGCPVVATRAGELDRLISEGVNGHLVDRSVDALLQGIERALANLPRLAGGMRQAIAAWDQGAQARVFHDVVRGVLDAQTKSVQTLHLGARPDLSGEVTVFVSTVGAGSYRECLSRLERQDVRFDQRVLNRISPLSAALEVMARECQTPYWIQVDEDMLLYEHAVRTLHARIEALGENCAICAGNLYDVHLERCIRGVKIFRRDIATQFPVEDAEDGVTRRNRSILAAGHTIDGWDVDAGSPLAEGTLGVHGTRWTSASIYSRYFSLERRRRRDPLRYAWFDRYHDEFLHRMTAEPTELNFFALMGVVGGAHSDLDVDHGSNHYERWPVLQGLDELQRYFLDAVSSREHPVPIREHSPDL